MSGPSSSGSQSDGDRRRILMAGVFRACPTDRLVAIFTLDGATLPRGVPAKSAALSGSIRDDVDDADARAFTAVMADAGLPEAVDPRDRALACLRLDVDGHRHDDPV